MGPVLGLDRLFSAILALSLFEGAYASEIFRAGISSVDRGQIEAAASIGMKKNPHLPPYHSAPGSEDDSSSTYQPGHFADKGLGTCLDHCHI